jgi:hypothetical protein
VSDPHEPNEFVFVTTSSSSLLSVGSTSSFPCVSVGSEEGHLRLSAAEQEFHGGENLLSSGQQTGNGSTVSCSFQWSVR